MEYFIIPYSGPLCARKCMFSVLSIIRAKFCGVADCRVAVIIIILFCSMFNVIANLENFMREKTSFRLEILILDNGRDEI